ncbi:uncharacterized protein LOC105702804 [Orussus abietinus]|uniref:uncharacterized protein LOC105702804 n=1 Tax=Orussus abietinus TaxID=222816 RepID=UPI0006267686|nr:uncharacterized protein LOC105702804 [Orussus abietinus]
MSAYARENRGYKYLLTVIDIFSKFAWAVAKRSKNAEDLTVAMKYTLNLMQKHGITLCSTFSNLKASICERFNRILKSKMWMKFSLWGHDRWLNLLSGLVSSYNNSRHRTIGMRPADVTAKNKKILPQRVFNNLKTKSTLNRSKFKVGKKIDN